jgi:hypothetical protein
VLALALEDVECIEDVEDVEGIEDIEDIDGLLCPQAAATMATAIAARPGRRADRKCISGNAPAGPERISWRASPSR